MLESNPEAKARLKETAVKYLVVLAVGLAYLAIILLTDVRLPCIFHTLTGLKCPGCGITRMIVSLVRLDFAAAFGYNPFLFITGPILLAYLAAAEIKYVLHGTRGMGRWQIVLWVELVLTFAYGILRNILPV